MTQCTNMMTRFEQSMGACLMIHTRSTAGGMPALAGLLSYISNTVLIACYSIGASLQSGVQQLTQLILVVHKDRFSEQ